MAAKNNHELHLFIVWEKARPHEKQILQDISKEFDIVEVFEVHWSKRNFSSNLTRFYGVNLPPGSDKEKHCGNGPFLLVIVKDRQPDYQLHQTSKGEALVNTKAFLAKSRHREWSGGGHKVHATNTIQETDHDLVLLLGKNSADYSKTMPKAWSGKVQQLKRDLTGCEGWDDLIQLLYALNNTIKYVVLRNFEPLPANFYTAEHGDIDLLVSDLQSAIYILNSEPVFPEDYRVHHKAVVGGEEVLFDLRHVGDDYYDIAWEKDILKHRQLRKNAFYVPAQEDLLFSMLYHAVIHKPVMAEDYVQKLPVLAESIGLELKKGWITQDPLAPLAPFMLKHEYRYTVAQDVSVYLNKPMYNKAKMRLTWAKLRHRVGLKAN